MGYGHRKDNKDEKGMFPEVFIKRYKKENIEKRNSKRGIFKVVKLLVGRPNKNKNNLKYKESKESKESKENGTENSSKIKSETIKTPTLVIATHDFTAKKTNQLSIKKDDILMVTNWNGGSKGWVYGHRKDHKKEKGMFPEVFIKICKDENIEKHHVKSKISPRNKIKFDKKVNTFRNRNIMTIENKKLKIFINRRNLFFDAYNQIIHKSPQDLKKKLFIIYKGEEGVDAGGLLRDFFYQISREIGNPNYSLFQYSNTNSYELEINPMSGINPEHLNYFKFIGRIMGMAILHQQYLSVNFTLLFYKKLLNKSLELSDMEFIDPEINKNIKWLQENDGAENSFLNFTLNTEDCFGNHKTIDLIPNGANIDVTDSNKNEYINLVIEYKLNDTNDKEQLEALKEGFYEIIPKDINETFNELDLKYLISGFNEINVDDWKNNTDYEGYKKTDITVVYFWRCVREFNNENRTKLLLFATGNSQIPVTGFKDLQGSGRIQHFKLKRLISSDIENTLPISHTCFNCIDLPPYVNYTALKQKLLLAISEGMGSFLLR